MSKLLVMADARPRIEAAFPSLVTNKMIKWPNAIFDLPDPPVPYLAIEVSSGHNRPITITGDNLTNEWEARGQLWCHVLVPAGTEYITAFTIQDQIGVIFRSASNSQVVYESISDDPGDFGGENGNFWRSSVLIEWRLQSIVS